ncbi:MAG TPA: TFIIB-type zinc ribbon-containing protein [Anaerolineales bacterium]|nr:TFIIB-type zinc ribbon-containing protein [Anaerolineales bacterium]
MNQENYKARQVRAKTQQVLNYHYDETKPGKPLQLLIPGGLIALASLALIVFIAYRVWFEASLDSATGIPLLIVLAPFYIGGVFLFSYGYELYNLPRALRLTAIVVFITVAAVVIVAVLFVLLGSGTELGGSSKSSPSRSRSRELSRSTNTSTSSTSSSSSGGGWNSGVGPIFIGGLGMPGGTTTREVVKEVPAQPTEPAKPQPITCPNCGRSYIPEENNFVCPGCGAPSPTQSETQPTKE